MKKNIDRIRASAKSYGSIPFWSWNDRLDEKELRRQIRHMHGEGMNGFFMHARGGLETEYLSDEWFSCINACIDEAKGLGMEAWSYDENGWPSGFAGGALLTDSANFAVSLEKTEGPFPEGDSDAVAVYRKEEDGTFTLITEDTGDESYLILRMKYDSSYVDVLDGRITDKFIAATHEEYKRRIAPDDFGTVMPGFFTDEPQYYRWGQPYSKILPEEFEAAYGYSIYDGLPALFFDISGGDKFRYDYYYLIHRLYINNFIKKIYEWCEENGCGITGHTIEESSLSGQMMCAGGCMPFYEYETMPGIDYLSRFISDDISMKQLGSVCAQTGKKKAISEMFGCSGWDVTPTELKRMAEVQYAGGVNVMCQHLYPYSERGQRKRDYPHHYSEHSPWDSAMPRFNSYFNNLGAALATGREYAPVLVIHPIHGAYCKYIRDMGDSLSEIEGKFFALSRLLGHNQVPYHYGDEWMMERLASVDGDKIKVGECVYSAVILPFTYSIDSSTASLLEEFINGGGKVWLYGGVPPYVDGKAADLPWLRSTADFDCILSYRKAVSEAGGNGVPKLRQMTRIFDGGTAVFLTNISGDTLENVKVRFADTSRPWARLDIAELVIRPIYMEGDCAVLNFAPSESYFLISGDGIDCAGLTEMPRLPKEFIPVPKKVRLCGDVTNVLTLDICARSDDGVTFEEPMSVYGVKDNLLSERYKGEVHLRFTFDLQYEPRTLKAVLEPMYKRVTVNGTEITPDKNDWWFDRSFASAEIGHLVRRGVNEITVTVDHYQRDYVYYVLYGGVSESLRNCLAFDTEVEPMYLIGDFAVGTNGEFTDRENLAVTYDGTFTLTSLPDEVDSSNAVISGFPFFAGSLTVAFDYSYSVGMPTVLRLDGRHATASVTVNGVRAEDLLFTDTADLADHLRQGDNEIRVTVTNSMRNAFGPHHRREVEYFAIGPSDFSFEKEWNGRECGGYMDRYAFVKFGLVK